MTGPRQINFIFVLDLPGTKREQGHAISQAYSLADVMRHKHNSAPGFRPDAFELVVEKVAGLGIERRKRLVHQQHVGFGCKGAGERHALPHST